MSNDMQKLKNFANKDKYWNVFILVELIFSFSLWVAILSLKVNKIDGNEAAEDNKVDFLKLFLVWTNVFLLAVLLFQKNVMTNGAFWLKATFGSVMFALNIAALINFGILVRISLNINEGGEQKTVLPYNYDWLTLGITMFTDISYLIFYSMFKATRAAIITAVLIVIEIIVFAACANLGSDIGVDVANATLALITSSMAIILWSGQVVLDERGNPSQFKDFFARDDLVEMEVMVSSDSMSKA